MASKRWVTSAIRANIPTAAPADAAPEVRERVHWVSARRGGDGAIRELVELVLKAQGRWETLLATWLEVPSRA